MLLVGECDDRQSERIQRLRSALDGALIQSPPVLRIREAIWTKLISNMSVSVLCMLTAKTARAAVQDPALQDVVSRMLEEAQSIARSCYPAASRARSGAAPNHRPSLLQDYERGRAMEIDALVRAPQAFARAAGLLTPTLDVLAALAICRAQDKGLYQQV